MKKLKGNKKYEQLNHAKPEICRITNLAERNADDEVDPLIERIKCFNIQVVDTTSR